jgi:Xaa-Pro aminopeptidase
MRSKESDLISPRNAYDPETPDALVAFMAGGWTDRAPAAASRGGTAAYRARRDALSGAYPGAYLIVPAGVEQIRENDTVFRFRPNSDFAYLVPPGEQGTVLVMEPRGSAHRGILFVPERNRGTAEFFTDRARGEIWVGRRRGVAESTAYFDVDECRPLEALEPFLRELHDAGHATKRLGADDDFATHLSEMRLIKDGFELDELRKACGITKRAFEDVIRLFPTAKSEREFEAAFWSRARIEANDTGYLTVAAAGDHACTLHWTHNDGAVEAGQLLLLDAGVECDSLYTADVTRTLPISGRFTPEQRAVYDLVFAAQQAAMAAVAPGNDFLEPNRRAMRVLAEGLVDLGVLRVSADEALDPERQFFRRYTLHNVSHMLGLDVHDCAKARAHEYRFGTLREGMVLTVEPGLYFQPDDATVPEALRGIGVRIEDDVAVTRDGCENLSAILPSRAGDVEAWIAELVENR